MSAIKASVPTNEAPMFKLPIKENFEEISIKLELNSYKIQQTLHSFIGQLVQCEAATQNLIMIDVIIYFHQNFSQEPIYFTLVGNILTKTDTAVDPICNIVTDLTLHVILASCS